MIEVEGKAQDFRLVIHQPEWFGPFALRYQLVDDSYRVNKLVHLSMSSTGETVGLALSLAHGGYSTVKDALTTYDF